MTTIAIVYRDNELFGRYVPKMVDFLRSKGHEVQTKVFPQGTPEEAITNDVPAADFVFTDETVSRATGVEPHQTLDTTFAWATQIALQVKGYRGKAGEEVIKDTLKQLVTEALSNGATAPMRIYVAQKNLCDHKGSLRWPSEKEAAESVASWFQELFPEADVEIIDEAQPPISQSYWLVTDRHHVEQKDVEGWREAFGPIGLVFRLPLETVAEDLGTLGLVSKDEAEFEKQLCQIIQSATF